MVKMAKRNALKTLEEKFGKTKEEMKEKMFMEDGKTPRCLYCGKAMKNWTPQKGKFKGQLQKYCWYCDCPNYPSGIVMSVG